MIEESKVSIIEKALSYLMFMCVLFPYISIVHTGFDSQPYAIICSLIYLLYVFSQKQKVIYSPAFIFLILYLIVAFIISVVEIYLLDTELLIVARALANYISITLLPIALIISLSRGINSKKLIILAIFTYLLAGMLQYFISVDIFNFILDIRTTENRGVTSLAPEPTYYGVVCFLFNFIVITSSDFKRNEKLFFSFLLLFQTVFLAKSSMVLLFYIMFIMSSFISIKYLYRGVVLFFSTLSIIYIIYNLDYFEQTRIKSILVFFLDKGFYAFAMDASMNERLSHVFFSFYGFIDNFMFPGGYASFEKLLQNKESISSGFFWYGGVSNKIMSYIGANIYETGFFSLLYFTAIYIMIPNDKLKISTFGFFIPLFACIPLGNPIAGLVVTLLYLEGVKNV